MIPSHTIRFHNGKHRRNNLAKPIKERNKTLAFKQITKVRTKESRSVNIKSIVLIKYISRDGTIAFFFGNVFLDCILPVRCAKQLLTHIVQTMNATHLIEGIGGQHSVKVKREWCIVVQELHKDADIVLAILRYDSTDAEQPYH